MQCKLFLWKMSSGEEQISLVARFLRDDESLDLGTGGRNKGQQTMGTIVKANRVCEGEESEAVSDGYVFYSESLSAFGISWV